MTDTMTSIREIETALEQSFDHLSKTDRWATSLALQVAIRFGDASGLDAARCLSFGHDTVKTVLNGIAGGAATGGKAIPGHVLAEFLDGDGGAAVAQKLLAAIERQSVVYKAQRQRANDAAIDRVDATVRQAGQPAAMLDPRLISRSNEMPRNKHAADDPAFRMPPASPVLATLDDLASKYPARKAKKQNRFSP